MRPELAEDLVDVTTGPDSDVIDVVLVQLVEEILAVVQLEDRGRAFLSDRPALLRERRVSHLGRHRLTSPQGRQVQRGEERDPPVPRRVERVVLGAFQDPVAVGVALDHEPDRLFDLRPVAFQERVVLRHLVFAVGAEDATALPVIGGVVGAGQVRPHPDPAVVVHRDAEIDLFAVTALDIREQPARCLGVMPDMGAGTLTAPDPFPGPEAAVTEPVRRGGGEDRGVGHRPVEEPVR